MIRMPARRRRCQENAITQTTQSSEALKESGKRKRQKSSNDEPRSKVKIMELMQKEEVKEEQGSGGECSDFEEYNASRQEISEYELLRNENIKKNLEMFKEFNVTEAKHEYAMTSKKKPVLFEVVGLQSKREKVVRPTLPTRRSLRIQKIGAEMTTFQPHYVFPELIEERERKPEKMPMEVINNIKQEMCDTAINSWNTMSEIKVDLVYNSADPDIQRYKDNMKSLAIQHVGKVTKNRIFSLAVHPMQEKVLAVAGDKWGGVGIWDVGAKNGEDEVFLFEPHTRPINCLKFSPFHPNKMYSCSYDGTVRCGDFQKQSFTQVYGFDENTDKRFNYFAWPKDKPSTLLAAVSSGEVLVIDVNTGKAEQACQLHVKSVRCVDCHPLNENVFAASCYDGTVATWDLRMMKANNCSCLSSFRASRTVSTCFFSPKTGNKLLMTSLDNYLSHNNWTGRWLTSFRACWDPKTDNCFVCGSMAKPRQLDVFGIGADGQLSSFSIQHEYQTSVGSVNAFHPANNVLISGNASGKIYVWK